VKGKGDKILSSRRVRTQSLKESRKTEMLKLGGLTALKTHHTSSCYKAKRRKVERKQRVLLTKKKTKNQKANLSKGIDTDRATLQEQICPRSAKTVTRSQCFFFLLGKNLGTSFCNFHNCLNAKGTHQRRTGEKRIYPHQNTRMQIRRIKRKSRGTGLGQEPYSTLQ